jgi:DNA-binding transcriptional MerR regulator
MSADQMSVEQVCADTAGAGPVSAPMAIGEVLAALRSDFPDITVSKIRFLDGAGLVSPQRSGSGYRRFSDTDLLRLRQVLLLQRDHYLPLKVIRAHIAAGTLDRALVEVAHPPAPTSPRPAPERSTELSTELSTEHSTAESTAESGVESPERPPTAPGARDGSSTAPPPVRAPAPAQGQGRSPARERVGPVAPPPAPSAAAHGPAAALATAAGHGPGAAHGPAAPYGPGAGRSPAGAAAVGPGTRAFAGHPRRLRVEDLLRLSGLPIETLTELETAGLLRSRNGWYHAEDLAVAVAAAQLAAHGIGPRHLRSLRNGADRELGLLEQSLVPLLRRARPDARTRAEDTARTLRELYAQVHTALVTAGLRDLGIDPR